MALLNVSLSNTPNLSERARAVVEGFRKAAHRRAVYRRTLRELRALTAREMTDLGIDPAMITDVAREAAYGK